MADHSDPDPQDQTDGSSGKRAWWTVGALTFVAIPLETFVHSIRTVVGLIAIGVLRFVSLVLRLVGSGCRTLGVLLTHIYDLPLFIPLWWAARDRERDSEDFSEVTS